MDALPSRVNEISRVLLPLVPLSPCLPLCHTYSDSLSILTGTRVSWITLGRHRGSFHHQFDLTVVVEDPTLSFHQWIGLEIVFGCQLR